MNAVLRLVLLISIVLFPAGPARADEEKVFLLTVPLSGPLGPLGNNAREGAELALKTWGGAYALETMDENSGEFPEDLSLDRVSVALGYFTESRFVADAPRYLYTKKPVLLPYLTSGEAAGRGPASFFRLMPTYREQGQFLGLEVLRMKKRPQRLLIVDGPGDGLAVLTAAFQETLTSPPAPEPASAAPGQKPPKPAPAPKPLDAKAEVRVMGGDRLAEPEGLAEAAEFRPDLIILALSLDEALRLAPGLAGSKMAKTPIWSGTFLGFREVGAAYASLGLNLVLALPAVNLADDGSKAVQDFNRRYLAAYHHHPTWVSALAYDSLNLAIKAVSSAGAPEEIPSRLFGEHHALGVYQLAPGGGGNPPLDFMPVKAETLGYLP